MVSGVFKRRWQDVFGLKVETDGFVLCVVYISPRASSYALALDLQHPTVPEITQLVPEITHLVPEITQHGTYHGTLRYQKLSFLVK